MDWIKRNLIFVSGAVVAVLLLGLAAWYTLSGYSHNASAGEELFKGYEELKRLKALKPAPGGDEKVDKVNNIKLAREQQKEAQQFIGKLTQRLQAIPALPEGTNLLAKDYSAALQRTIDELQRDATNSSVLLPPKYKFSFEAQAGRVQFTGSLEPLAAQLGEVKAISGILNRAKINSLDGIRRGRVSPDDNSGAATDYLDVPAITNELAIITAYEVSFRCFTPELAAALIGFANSPYALIVKGVNLEPAPVSGIADPQGYPGGVPVAVGVYAPPTGPVRSRYGEDGGASAAFQSRYGRPMGPTPAPAPTPLPATAAAPARPGLQTFLTEKQLKVTLLIHVLKLLPAK